jgi:antitoxin (DNA-binding transcriptional repressor) of toxin-antitoxin stability system
MKIVTIDEAQTQLPALVAAVTATGEPVLIYHEGKPIADLVPHRMRSRLVPHPVMQRIRIDYDPTEPLTADEWPEPSA